MTGYGFVSEHTVEYPVARLCRVVGVNRSGFYQWRNRGLSARAVADAELLTQITDVYEQSRGTYGAPRVHGQLHRRGHRVGRKRVARLMPRTAW
jgi:putative transposase